jgi:hypothetical protein
MVANLGASSARRSPCARRDPGRWLNSAARRRRGRGMHAHPFLLNRWRDRHKGCNSDRPILFPRIEMALARERYDQTGANMSFFIGPIGRGESTATAPAIRASQYRIGVAKFEITAILAVKAASECHASSHGSRTGQNAQELRTRRRRLARTARRYVAKAIAPASSGRRPASRAVAIAVCAVHAASGFSPIIRRASVAARCPP